MLVIIFWDNAKMSTIYSLKQRKEMKKIFLLSLLALFMIRAIAQPSTAAPTPTASSGDVLSLFGDAYTNYSSITWHPSWGQSTQYATPTIGGASTLAYTTFNYEGIEFPTAVNASSYSSLHLDVWTSDCTTFDVYLINTSPSTVEQKYSITPTASGWTSIDIPLSNYTSIALGKINQIKLQSTPFGWPTGSTSVYLQNFYFWKSANVPTLTNFSVPDHHLGDASFALTAPTSNSNGTFTYTSSNTNVATVIDNVVTIVGVGTTTITANQAASGSYDAGSVSDNMTVSYAPPSTAAPTPTTASSYVISLYGGTYTNVSGIDWHPGWGQATAVSYAQIASTPTITYSALTFEGVQLSSDLDVSQMDSIHLDIWSPDVTSLNIGLINTNGGTVRMDKTITLTNNGWNSISIPLTYFNTVDMSKIGQLIFVANSPTSGGVIYLQNIYFVNAVGKATITGFSIPTQTIGVNTTYSITKPTSNSTGAFTYSSSNTSVATISDNVITIVGAGTSTITATQAADANYSQSIITTTLTVNYAGPTTAASVPTVGSPYVLSLWGDAYTNVSSINWRPDWGQATQYASTTVGGKTTIKYSGLTFEGVQFASDVNASLMDSIHFDIWTPNVTSLTIGLIKTNGGTVRMDTTLTLTTNSWNSINIPLTYFSTVDMSKIGQMIFVGNTPNSGGVLYIQNVYFMNVVGKPTIGSFSIPTQTLGTATYAITKPSSNSTGAFTYSSSNTSVATVSGNVITLKAVGTSTITATQAADANYLQGSVSTILTVDYAGPSTAAAVPTAASTDVISLWGDKYTNVSGTTWNPIWGQNPAVVTSTTSVGTKTTLKYSSLTYQGVQFSSSINASSMNLLHFDVWTPNCTNFDLYLINTTNGDNQLVTVTPSINGWNSINIPLSSYSRIANHVDQFKIVSNTPTSGGVLYLQNIYFAKATPIWSGSVSTDWSLATNWQYGLAPTSTSAVSIPSGLSNQPALVANTTVAGITLNGRLALNGNTLTITGVVTGSGTISGTTSSSLVVAGTVGTINFTPTANSLQNLTINSGSATLGNALNVYGTFSPTAGTFNTGGNLNLKSTSIANTAVVGVVGGIINGTVTVERYIPAGLRTFRDIGAEVVNAGSIYDNWQEGGVNTNGYGIQITGKQGTTIGTDPTTGFDYSLTGNHSLYTYLNNVWDSVLTTKGTNLSPYQGYRVLVRGDRSGSLQTQPNINNAAIIRAKGNLVTGDVTFNNLTSGASNYSFVANPYVSPVSWSAVVSASQNINGSFWYCDPTFTDANGYTSFIAYNNINGVSNPLGLSNLNGYLQPGQAFFVQNGASGTPLLKFTEACKTPAQSKTAIFGTTSLNRIAVGLYKGGNNIDGAVAVFSATNSLAIGNEDSKKFPNHGENLAFNQAGTDLCINGLALPKSTDVLPIHLYNLQANTSYTVRFDAAQYSSNGLQAFVQDNVTAAKTAITGNNTTITFTTNASNSSSFANRYSVVFGTSTLPVVSINLTATAQTNGVAINWSTIGAVNLSNFTLEHSTNGTDFSVLSVQKASNVLGYSYLDASIVDGTVYYRIKATDNLGAVSYSKVITVKLSAIAAKISIFPNPVSGNSFNLSLGKLSAGKYAVGIFNSLGKQVFSKVINHTISVEKVSLDSHLALGVYSVKVTDVKGATYQTQLEIN